MLLVNIAVGTVKLIENDLGFLSLTSLQMRLRVISCRCVWTGGTGVRTLILRLMSLVHFVVEAPLKYNHQRRKTLIFTHESLVRRTLSSVHLCELKSSKRQTGKKQNLKLENTKEREGRQRHEDSACSSSVPRHTPPWIVVPLGSDGIRSLSEEEPHARRAALRDAATDGAAYPQRKHLFPQSGNFLLYLSLCHLGLSTQELIRECFSAGEQKSGEAEVSSAAELGIHG